MQMKKLLSQLVSLFNFVTILLLGLKCFYLSLKVAADRTV